MADEELRNGGQQFRMQFLGWITIETSMRTLPSVVCSRVIKECIRLVAMAAEGRSDEPDEMARKIIGNTPARAAMQTVDVSCSTRAIVAAHADEGESDVFGLTLHSHPIAEIYFDYVGYVWRHGRERECYVYKVHDAALVASTLRTIFNLRHQDENVYEKRTVEPEQAPTPSTAAYNFIKTQVEELKSNDELYFHRVLTREEAQALLISEGNFLLRQNSMGQLVISGKNAKDFVHAVLEPIVGEHGELVLKTVKDFTSVRELIRFHVQTLEPLRAGTELLVLNRPVERDIF